MSLFKIHARDIYQGQMALEALSRTCGADVIYYTHLHPTCNSQRSEYNSYRAGRRRITISQLQKKILIRSWTGKIFCWNWRHNCKTISEQSLEMSKRNTSGKIAEVYVACMFRWQMLYSELIITQYLLWS